MALIMGVLNVTDDSFSDGGRFLDSAAAVVEGLEMVRRGADLIDVGGESTRPGAAPVSLEAELARVMPVVQALRASPGPPVSVDTMKPEVASAAVGAGAVIWNDVNALRAPGACDVAASLQCGVILMHMLGDPRTMQLDPRYGDVVGEVEDFLLERAEAAMLAGVQRDKIWIDPGIGFGKTLAHNLELLRNLERLCGHGFPVVLGVSRKSLIKALDPGADGSGDRLGGSLSAAVWGVLQGCAVLRVHDVRATAQAVRVLKAIQCAPD